MYPLCLYDGNRARLCGVWPGVGADIVGHQVPSHSSERMSVLPVPHRVLYTSIVYN